MAKPLRPKRGTTAKNDAFVGLASEITVDTEKHSIRVHDGVTAGGHALATEADLAAVRTEAQASASAAQASASAAQATADAALPKSGGTISGDIVFGSDAMVIRKPTSDKYLAFRGGDGYSTGASMVLYGKSASDTPGAARLIAHDGTNNYSLYCYPDGKMTWAGKAVERVNSSGDGWIRYESGKLIAKGSITCSTANAVTKYTLLSPFKDKNYRVAFSVQGASGSTAYAQVKRIYTDSTASVLAVQSSVGGVTVEFVAFGEWK